MTAGVLFSRSSLVLAILRAWEKKVSTWCDNTSKFETTSTCERPTFGTILSQHFSFFSKSYTSSDFLDIR